MKEFSLVLLWAALLALLGISLWLANMTHVALATFLIFAVALLKAVLVAVYYMRLKWEPRYVLGILLVGIGFMLLLYFALVPDIVYVYGK